MPPVAKVRCSCGCGQAPETTSRMRKLECSRCGYIVRVSRTHLERGLPTCPCGMELEPHCLWDRATAGDERAESEAMHACLSRFGVPGYRSTRVRTQARCTACRKFVSNPRAACPHCGFLDGAGFIGGGASDSIPF